MSTLISELDNAPAQGDGDFVQNILNEMNGGAGGGNSGTGGLIQPPPAVGTAIAGQVIQAPNPNTVAPLHMDAGPATAHIIGGAQPTPADFARMMGGGGGGGNVAAAPQGGEAWGAAYTAPAAPPQYMPRARKSWLSRSLDEFRTPMLVALLVLAFSLPVVNFLFAHYIPSVVKPTGELTPIGLIVKSLAAGAAFWVLQRVVVPLLSN
jgi:hypothetical protein